METAILNKQMLIDFANGIEDNEVILISSIIQGQVSGATKKKLKSFSIGFTNDCFKDPSTIGDLINSKLFGMIIIDKKTMNKATLKLFEDSQKGKKLKSKEKK